MSDAAEPGEEEQQGADPPGASLEPLPAPSDVFARLLERFEGDREEPVRRGELRDVVQTIGTVTHYQGPLPLPEHLREYDSLIDDGAQRIMAMAEKEQAHRHHMEQRQQELIDRAESHDYTITRRGQHYGLVICLAVLAAGTGLAVLGHEIIGATLVGLDLVALAAVFVAGRYLPSRSGRDEADEPSED